MKTKIYTCPICRKPHKNQEFAEVYKVLVCRECDKGAVTGTGKEPIHVSRIDSGDNPVFIGKHKCWRRYKFGGFITMHDEFNCEDLKSFYDKIEKKYNKPVNNKIMANKKLILFTNDDGIKQMLKAWYCEN